MQASVLNKKTQYKNVLLHFETKLGNSITNKKVMGDH